MFSFYMLVFICWGLKVQCKANLLEKGKIKTKFTELHPNPNEVLFNEPEILGNRKKTFSNVPIVLTTWNFTEATKAAWETLSKGNTSAIDAVVEGCSSCERLQCDFTVGYGGSPDETGETTLDAMVFNGDSFSIGAVGGLKRIKNAIGVARAVMLHSKHTILVGESATQFAISMGFSEESLSTKRSIEVWKKWKQNNCQPNFRKDVLPNPEQSCGPYHQIPDHRKSISQNEKYNYGHDTISQIVMDKFGTIAVGTSTNGAQFKIPGRMSDASIPGAAGFADSKVGAAVATGDGDVMMRFSPAALIVERMRHNMSPHKAATQVIKMIKEKFPTFQGALIAFNSKGNFSAACSGMSRFPFSVARSDLKQPKLYFVKCT